MATLSLSLIDRRQKVINNILSRHYSKKNSYGPIAKCAKYIWRQMKEIFLRMPIYLHGNNCFEMLSVLYLVQLIRKKIDPNICK